MYVIQLESGWWRAVWPGDPGRTGNLNTAKRYTTMRGAKLALARARTYRKFVNAKIMTDTEAKAITFKGE